MLDHVEPRHGAADAMALPADAMELPAVESRRSCAVSRIKERLCRGDVGVMFEHGIGEPKLGNSPPTHACVHIRCRAVGVTTVRRRADIRSIPMKRRGEKGSRGERSGGERRGGEGRRGEVKKQQTGNSSRLRSQVAPSRYTAVRPCADAHR